MRSLVFNLAVASGDEETYKAVQKLYIEVGVTIRCINFVPKYCLFRF